VIRGLAVAAAILACLAGIYLMAMSAAKSTVLLARSGPAAEELREPEIVLRDVEVREIREDGRSYRLSSDNATYSVLSKRLSAEKVTVTLREGRERTVVHAPRARWSMEEGRMDLPEGGSAENGAGWTAAVPEARIDLRAQVMTAPRASLSIPGVRVAGTNLVWRWQEGTVEIDAPKSRVSPERLGAAGRPGENRE
jgi:hypothetical protein